MKFVSAIRMKNIGTYTVTEASVYDSQTWDAFFGKGYLNHINRYMK